MDRRSWFLLLTLGAIWGASYMFIEIGLRDLSPAMVAFVRIALAALVLSRSRRRRERSPASGRLRSRLVAVGAIQVAGPSC